MDAKITITFTFNTLDTAQAFLEHVDSFRNQEYKGHDISVSSDDAPLMGREFIEHLLGQKARRPVANGQKAIIKALIDVPIEEGLSYDDFVKSVGRTPQAMPGTLGAFSRRIANTSYYPAIDVSSPIEVIMQTSREGESFYSLHPWVINTINELFDEGQIEWLRDGESY
ncbi:MAG: hypothetical protein KC423_13575 [Anaerolineales bacterium]|nr:hypothetical protein [Anaerolineales bacterium]